MQGKGKLRLREIAAPPPTPPADEADVYLLAGAPGNLYLKKDDGTVVDLEGGGLLSGTLYSARNDGVVPDTGADMTDEIIAFFANCPLGAIGIVDPGVYKISNTVHLSRTINVIMSGVIFDLEANTPATTFSPGIPENYNGGYLSIASREAGTLTDRAAMIWGTSGGNRPAKNWIMGPFIIRRTASANTAAARLHCGFLMLAPFECRADNITAENFREGIVGMGGTAQGFAYNFGDNLKTLNCRYGLTLYCNRATGAGWANQNTFRGGRFFVESAIRGDASWIEAQWEPIRILWESGGTSPAPPNNNVFDFVTIEGAYGRKVRCEGRDNSFRDIRYEETHTAGTTDITIGEVSRTNSNFSRNLFIGGDTLGTIVALDNIEYLSSGGGNGLNNANTFIGGQSNLYVARVNAGDVNTTGHRFVTTGSTAAALSVGSATDPELVRLHHVFAALAAQGALEFLDTASVQRNAIGMITASPYDFRTLAGLNIASVFRVRIDGTIDAQVLNPQTGGQILVPVGTGFVKAWASSSNDPVIIIADSNRDARLVLKAQETVGATTYLDALLFYDDDVTPTLKNIMGIHASSDLPGGSGSRPILIKWGIDANEQEENADSRIRGENITNLFYIDASTDRVGINTATPDSQLHVVGKIHGSDELELDGALNHDGTTAGFFGTAPATQPTVTGSRAGNLALASLLTALAGLGLIVDSTTA